MAEEILVCGHQNPDTDSIMSALVFAHYLNATGKKAKAVALGAPNAETAFALDYFQQKAPEVITGIEAPGTVLALVDHNEKDQSVPNRDAAIVAYVVDHHRLANFETAGPLFYRAEPVGCTNTILYKMYRESGLEIDQTIAGLMVSAIISDTLLKKSPTCTNEDIEAMETLAKIAQIDLNHYGLELLKAGTALGDKTPAEIIALDAKSFGMGAKNLRVAQVNTVDIAEMLAQKEQYLEAMEAERALHDYDLFLLLITDVLENNSLGLFVGEEAALLEAAFKQKPIDATIDLPGVVSRKKQVIPPLQEVIDGSY